MLTRRCSDRRFFLQPSALVNQWFLYLLAVAAERTGVVVHALCVMSNHYHMVVSDPYGRIPEFYHYLHEFTAKTLNAARGRCENMWSIRATSRVSLDDAAAVVDKVCYTLCNPVSSVLLKNAADWPGLLLWWKDGSVKVKRPPGFFSENGPMPETATLHLTPPPALVGTKYAKIDVMEESLDARQAKLHRDNKGKRYLGLKDLRRQKWSESPTTFAERCGLSPRVAAGDRWRRAEAIQRDREFVAGHADSRRQWLAGNRSVLWPAGTYLMRVLHNVPCRPPPPPPA